MEQSQTLPEGFDLTANKQMKVFYFFLHKHAYKPRDYKERHYVQITCENEGLASAVFTLLHRSAVWHLFQSTKYTLDKNDILIETINQIQR